MSPILLASFLLRLGALAGSVVLAARHRDRGLLGLVVLLACLMPHPGWLLAAAGSASLAAGAEAAVSLAALAAVGGLAHALRAGVRDRARFTAAFHSSPDAIIISTLADGRFVEVNEGFTERTGYTREEALGRTSQELGIWADPSQRDQLVAALRPTGEVRELEIPFRHRDGRPLVCLLSGSIIEVDGQRCLLAVIRDVTEERRLASERETFVAELEAKNAELERFTYTVSHDLKSPLVTIRGFLGFLERDLASGNLERVGQDVERIRQASETMRRLLDELLELSRIGRQMNPPEDFPLGELVREVLSLFEGRIAEGGVEVRVADDLPVVRGDRPRLLEVFQNLVDNALKFMGDQPRPRIEVAAQRLDGELVCTVSDNGVGIEARYLDKVFDLFERLDPGIDGTGVGLALVKRIVEVHGGRSWVESAGKGQGSTFCFTLPIGGEVG